MNTKEFAEEVHNICIKECYGLIYDWLEKKESILRTTEEAEKYYEFYQSLDPKNKEMLLGLLKTTSVNSVCSLLAILDNRCVGNFSEDFKLTYGDNPESLNNFELFDEFSNIATEWDNNI